MTVFVSFFFFFLLPDFPEESKWLKEDEKAFVSARLREDQGQSARDRKITLKDVGRVFKDYKVIVAGFMYFGLIVPAYSYAYFAPGIVSQQSFLGSRDLADLDADRGLWLQSDRDAATFSATLGCSIWMVYAYRNILRLLPSPIRVCHLQHMRRYHWLRNLDISHGQYQCPVWSPVLGDVWDLYSDADHRLLVQHESGTY